MWNILELGMQTQNSLAEMLHFAITDALSGDGWWVWVYNRGLNKALDQSHMMHGSNKKIDILAIYQAVLL